MMVVWSNNASESVRWQTTSYDDGIVDYQPDRKSCETILSCSILFFNLLEITAYILVVYSSYYGLYYPYYTKKSSKVLRSYNTCIL